MSMLDGRIQESGFGIQGIRSGIRSLPGVLAAAAIRAYQRWVSPYKGFRCAHRVLHRGRSCSQFALDAVESCGVLAALPAIREQFRQCREAAVRLRRQRRLVLAVSSNPLQLPPDSSPPRRFGDRISARIDDTEEYCETHCPGACGEAAAQGGAECLSQLICSAW